MVQARRRELSLYSTLIHTHIHLVISPAGPASSIDVITLACETKPPALIRCLAAPLFLGLSLLIVGITNTNNAHLLLPDTIVDEGSREVAEN